MFHFVRVESIRMKTISARNVTNSADFHVLDQALTTVLLVNTTRTVHTAFHHARPPNMLTGEFVVHVTKTASMAVLVPAMLWEPAVASLAIEQS